MRLRPALPAAPLAALLLAVACAASAGAQTAVPEPVVLAPGHPDLDLSGVRPQTGASAVRSSGNLMGTVRDDVTLDGGVLTVVTSTVVPTAGAPVRDSTRRAWPSLAPLAHAAETAGQGGGVAYGTTRAAGTWGPAQALAPLDFALERPVFAPAALPYVVRALPLDRPGYRAVVPLFSARDRFQEAALTVVGPDTLALADGRTLPVVTVEQAGRGGLTRGFRQRHDVDPATREIVRTTLSPPGMTIEVAPLSAAEASTVWPLRARPSAPPVALVPGHPDLALDRLALGDVTTEMRETLPAPRALWRITETATRHADGTVTLTLAADGADGQWTVRDTARVAWPSLAPVSHRRALTGPTTERVDEVRFDGLHVTGASAGTPVDLDLARPAFGPRTVPILARALPLRRGYSAVFSTFTAADRLQEQTLTVVGREDVATAGGVVSAWVVEHDLDGVTRRYAVDPETRDLLSITYSSAPGTLIETVQL